jgi:hypothetical protein
MHLKDHHKSKELHLFIYLFIIILGLGSKHFGVNIFKNFARGHFWCEFLVQVGT